MGIPLKGVLDLSDTKVETIGKNAFKGCTGITGVILPSTLKNIGSTSAGSVFHSCSGMQFVRTAGKNSEAVFELPDNLEVIGKPELLQMHRIAGKHSDYYSGFGDSCRKRGVQLYPVHYDYYRKNR